MKPKAIEILLVSLIICLLGVAFADIKQGTEGVITWFHSDSVDHQSYKTGLAPTVWVSKQGGAWNTSTNAASEIGYGRYKLTLTSAETDTAGELCIHAWGTNADFAQRCVLVAAHIEADTYDRIGAPTGASVADDIATVNSAVAAVKTKTDNLPASPAATGDIPSAATITDSVWDELIAGHLGVGSTGAKLNTAATGVFVLPPMQSRVYNSTATSGEEIPIYRGDTPTIPFQLFDKDGNPADYTGWTPKFGAKANPGDTAYVIAVKDATWTDASKGEGYVVLTSAETATVGKLYGEIELRNGESRLTGSRFILKIIEDVVD